MSQTKKIITNKTGTQWYGVRCQVPMPKIEVYEPTDSKTPYLIFDAERQDTNSSRKLLSYNFSERTDDLAGAFSFSFENDDIVVNGEKKTTFDAIPRLSIVKIYEADKKHPAFVGVVIRRHINSSMTAQGPRRSITISGKSIVSVLAEYMVSLDFRIMHIDYADNASRELCLELNQNKNNLLTIQEFMTITWNFFWKMGTDKDSTAIGSTLAKTIISNFIGEVADCIETGSVKTIHYPIANAPFNQGNNVISELWRNILPQPVYEIYAYCDRDSGKPKIMAREVPFGYKPANNRDWNNLDMYILDPLDLISYDLEQSTNEVYTVFCAYLIGSAFSREYNLAKSQDKQDDIMAKSSDKMALYGFKPLEISFRGYDMQGVETDDLKGAFKELNKKAKYWYERLDDMFFGTFTLVTDFREHTDGVIDHNPRIGCRIKFLGGEFYINGSEHRWQYGGTPTTTLSVTRGMKYDNDGYQIEGAAGILKDIGKKFREFED